MAARDPSGLERVSESGEGMTRASGGESRGQGYAAANARIQASSDAQQGRAPVLPHHAPAQGPSAAAAALGSVEWVRWASSLRLCCHRLRRSVPPPHLLRPSASRAPPAGPRHLPAAEARAPRTPSGRRPPLPNAICGLGPGGEML